jgi:hypothetical protein
MNQAANIPANVSFTNTINNNVLPGTAPSAIFVGPFPTAPSSSGNYRLQPMATTVIDTGSNAHYPSASNTASLAWIALDDMVTAGTITNSLRDEILDVLTNDLDGNPRFHNITIDLGAYEF